MARGTVKDPTGHQSQPHDFGYIQRANENDPDLIWPDPTQPENLKAIPFPNKEINGVRPYPKEGIPISFLPRKATVSYKGTELGTIGIGMTREQIESFGEKWEDK